MGLKKLFCGIFNCDAFKAHDTLLTGVDGKVVAVASDLGGVDAKVQSIIDNPPTVDLGDLPAKVAALGVMLTSLLHLTPMTIWLNVPSGAQNDEILVPVMVHTDLLQELKTFGLNMHFDPVFFELIGFEKGTLTQNWNTVDGNATSPGELTLGGFPGAEDAIVDDVKGSLIVVRLKVLAASGKSDISIDGYVDDIAEFLPCPSLATFSVK